MNALGFGKKIAESKIDKVLKMNPDIDNVEELVEDYFKSDVNSLRIEKILYILVIIVLFNVRAFAQFNQLNLDTTLNYPFNNSQVGGLFLNNPANFKTNIIYDPSLNLYFSKVK